jgi:hypothetical protein
MDSQSCRAGGSIQLTLSCNQGKGLQLNFTVGWGQERGVFGGEIWGGDPPEGAVAFVLTIMALAPSIWSGVSGMPNPIQELLRAAASIATSKRPWGWPGPLVVAGGM